ncbi:hypothetical protein [Nostoc sp.]|uniref:hypothetical protein n=1 Tax=Nostoc sp. TaxID=1180 RepID=UPI002FF461AF
MSDTYNNNFHKPKISNFANKIKDNVRQQANQNIYTSEQKQTLVDASTEIQRLIKQLEQNNPTANETEKIAYVNDETTPSWKRHLIGAFQ